MLQFDLCWIIPFEMKDLSFLPFQKPDAFDMLLTLILAVLKRTGFLVLFPILRGKLATSQQWAYCWLWNCGTQPVQCWDVVLPYVSGWAWHWSIVKLLVCFLCSDITIRYVLYCSGISRALICLCWTIFAC